MRHIIRCFLYLAAGLYISGCMPSQKGKEIKLKDVSTISLMKTHFGRIAGKEVFLYTLTNKHGITVKITNYGGIITEILMPGKDGKNCNIVLGYDSLQSYVANSPYFGAIVGRFANRIANGEFSLEGVKYKLARNNGNNALHGGLKGFDKVVWDAKEYTDTSAATLSLSYLSPDGELLNQSIANQLSTKRNLLILCGHYKGIDERIRAHFITREISVGDYVLSGGELAAMTLTDAIVRIIPGVLNDETSALSDSYQDNLLSPPVYTRPYDFRGLKVPDVLLSGNDKEIAQWKYEQSMERTRQRRPGLLDGET